MENKITIKIKTCQLWLMKMMIKRYEFLDDEDISKTYEIKTWGQPFLSRRGGLGLSYIQPVRKLNHENIIRSCIKQTIK